MEDRELLEMAAKAAGYEIEWVRNSGCYYRCEKDASREQWDALDDDGDAFRLACALKLDIEIHKCETIVTEGLVGSNEISEYDINSDRTARTRRAIVRAAAEIGKTIP